MTCAYSYGLTTVHYDLRPFYILLTSIPGVNAVVSHTETYSLPQCAVDGGATYSPRQQDNEPQCCHDTFSGPSLPLPDNALVIVRQPYRWTGI